jgi:DNA-binding MarR family transcriptional regulator
VTPQAMGELVDHLERLGYVRRVPNRRDRRAKLIVPTAAGYGCL